jgi:PIN domain nuclease of toxin-antitoxin system
MDVAVTDAHPLIWATTGHLRKLGSAARAFYERVENGSAALYVPTHVLIEIGEAHVEGEISFPSTSFEQWVHDLTSSGRYIPVDLSVEVVLRAQRFYQIPERGDRIAAATAGVYECPLITRDPEIGRASGVEILW